MTELRRIRILLVDDQKLFVESLKYVIEGSATDMEVVGIASNGIEALTMTKSLDPDLILMDVRMPEMDGVDATRLIHARYPDKKIIMLTTFLDDSYVRSALKHGAKGYILKNLRPDELLEAIRAVNRGSTSLSGQVTSMLVQSKNDGEEEEDFLVSTLSKREKEVAVLMMRSFNNKQIAEKLSLSEQTVRNYISAIYFKLDVNDRFEFIQKANATPSLSDLMKI